MDAKRTTAVLSFGLAAFLIGSSMLPAWDPEDFWDGAMSPEGALIILGVLWLAVGGLSIGGWPIASAIGGVASLLAIGGLQSDVTKNCSVILITAVVIVGSFDLAAERKAASGMGPTP